nr:uncharacterized protein LOC113395192 [Vanessa tameamea]
MFLGWFGTQVADYLPTISTVELGIFGSDLRVLFTGPPQLLITNIVYIIITNEHELHWTSVGKGSPIDNYIRKASYDTLPAGKFIAALAMTTAAQQQQQQWSPYNTNLQTYLQQHDQQFQPSEYSGGYDFGGHDGGSSGGHDFGETSGHGDFGNYGGHDLKAHSYPVHQHVEEENPEPIKHYKEVVVPVPKNVEFKVHQPILIPVPHPVPIQIPVPKAVVIPIIKEVSIPVEKSVPYPVERVVHVPKIKEVPFEVVKHIIVPVEKPVPFKVPVYETIIHTKKGSHKIR